MNARTWRTLRELVLVPGAAALAPWSAGFKWLAAHAADQSLYRDACEAAYAGAAAYFDIPDRDDWMRRHRLVRLVDHSDLYLMRTRTGRWVDRYIDVEGEWPKSGPFIAMTFHWGAGLWALAQLNRQQRRPRLVAGPAESAAVDRNSIAYRYGRARNAAVEVASGAPPIYTGGAANGIRQTLGEGRVVVALYDLPAHEGRSMVQTSVCGRPIQLPAGLARLAAEVRATVVPFSLGIDERTGRRRLRIEPAFRPDSAQHFADRLGESLTTLLAENSAAWHFAAFASQFFGPATGDHATP